MKVKFKSTEKMIRYNGTYSFVDGEEKDIPDSEGHRLIADFPDNFSEVAPRAKTDIDDKKKGWRPGRNKMTKSEQDK